MTKHKTPKLTLIEKILRDARITQWCTVDINNKFEFDGNKFVIDESVEDYIVVNKPKFVNGGYNDWTNETLMTKVLCIDNGDEIRFFNENIKEINHDLVRIVF